VGDIKVLEEIDVQEGQKINLERENVWPGEGKNGVRYRKVSKEGVFSKIRFCRRVGEKSSEFNFLGEGYVL